MRFFTLYTLISTLILGFIFNNLPKEDIQIVDVKFRAQYFLLQRNLLQDMGSNLKIVWKGENRIYMALRIRNKIKDIFDDNGNKIDQIVTKKDTSYFYYIIKKDAKEGLMYKEDSKDNSGVVFKLDSMMKFLSIDSSSYKILELELNNPIEVVKHKEQKIEKYAFKKTSITDPDTIYRYYDRDLTNVDFTFSKLLDKKNNSKLVKTIFIFNQQPKAIAKTNEDIPKREMSWEMKTGKIDNLEKLNGYIQQFEVERKKLKP